MTSWQTLLLIQMYKGKYLQLGRPVTDYEWMTLWGFVRAEAGWGLVIG